MEIDKILKQFNSDDHVYYYDGYMNIDLMDGFKLTQSQLNIIDIYEICKGKTISVGFIKYNSKDSKKWNTYHYHDVEVNDLSFVDLESAIKWNLIRHKLRRIE